MARDLGDVLHYFLPELEGDSIATGSPGPIPADEPASAGPPGSHVDDAPPDLAPADAGEEPTPALPILGVAIGDRDVVRAALLWNLCVEIARQGGRGVLVAPKADAATPLWPDDGIGPMGSEVCLVPAEDLRELEQAACAIARDRATRTRGGGIVLVRVPPRWLLTDEVDDAPCELLRWVLLFSSSEHREPLETYGIAKSVRRLSPTGDIGVTIHGARSVAEARGAFEQLAQASRRHLGAPLVSYGLLADDLHVYRAIVSRRAIGLEHPQSTAAKALQDVARLLIADAAERRSELRWAR